MANGKYAHVVRLEASVYMKSILKTFCQSYLASLLGITQPAVSYKIQTGRFTQDELCRIFQDNEDEISDNDILLMFGRGNSAEKKKCEKYAIIRK